MLGLPVDDVARAHLHDLAEVHNRDAIRQVQDHVEIVGDEEIGEAEAEAEIHQEVQHLSLDRDVES
jgi:hypothetical protein